MADISALENELNQMILSGKAMEGFEKFYADSCVMQENLDEPREGKAACRTYEEQFFGNVAEVHGVEHHGGAASGDRSYSEWTFDVTFKDGTRMRNTQVAARRWKDGKVVWERFYYKPNMV
jgi:ketosteroid isomerase-like protein